MAEEDLGWKACFIPIIAVIAAALIGNFLFDAVEKWKDYLAIAIMSVISITLLLFLIGIILGAKK